MQDLLLVMEAYLDSKGIDHFRDEMDRISFNLRFGGTSYHCHVAQDGWIMRIDALWNERIAIDEAEQAECVLTRLSSIPGAIGNTLYNPARGEVVYCTSVDLSHVVLKVDRVESILETLLDPFNVKLLATEMVLDGRLPESAAVEVYAVWHRERLANMIRQIVEGTGIDPSMN
jgi:hypothetical protein